MPRFGMDVTLAYPPEFKLMPDIVEQAKEQAKIAGTNFEIIDSKDGMTEACKDADVIYAKSWGPLLTTNDKTEGKKIQDMYKNWLMDDAKLKVAKKDAIYMHPLARRPRHRSHQRSVGWSATRWSSTKPRIACTRRKPSWR